MGKEYEDKGDQKDRKIKEIWGGMRAPHAWHLVKVSKTAKNTNFDTNKTLGMIAYIEIILFFL